MLAAQRPAAELRRPGDRESLVQVAFVLVAVRRGRAVDAPAAGREAGVCVVIIERRAGEERLEVALGRRIVPLQRLVRAAVEAGPFDVLAPGGLGGRHILALRDRAEPVDPILLVGGARRGLDSLQEQAIALSLGITASPALHRVGVVGAEDAAPMRALVSGASDDGTNCVRPAPRAAPA